MRKKRGMKRDERKPFRLPILQNERPPQNRAKKKHNSPPPIRKPNLYLRDRLALVDRRRLHSYPTPSRCSSLYSLHLRILCTRERAGHRGRGRSRRSRRGRIPRNDRPQPHPARAPRVLRRDVRLARAFRDDDLDELAEKDAEEGGGVALV
jgi:hypothetical protein